MICAARYMSMFLFFLLFHADQIQLNLVLLACIAPFDIVQAIHCGLPLQQLAA